MWRSLDETAKIVEQASSPERLQRFYALSCFWETGVYREDYQAHPGWPELLVPTDAGVACLEQLSDLRERFPAPDFYLALFGIFYHDEIIFDWEKSDVAAVTQLLDEDVVKRRIRLPYRFGRSLYDKFNDTYEGSRTEHLPAEEARRLLEGSEQGVYQIARLLCGPLGITESGELRSFPPGGKICLWHCSDPGCRAPHGVYFLPGSVAVEEAHKAIHEAMYEKSGPPSEWHSAITWLHRPGKWNEGRSYCDMTVILGDCIIGTERTSLLETAFRSRHGELLRLTLGRSPCGKQGVVEPPAEVTARLGEGEQVQLLLTLSDSALVNLIDCAIEDGLISIPPGEVRTPRQRPPMLGTDKGSVVGGFGIRSSKGNPIVNLISLVWRAYNQDGLLEELRWRLGAGRGACLREELAASVRRQGVASAVRNLILAGRDIARFACSELHLSVDPSRLDSSAALNKLLWKLGFDPPQYGTFIDRFLTRLKTFNETILTAGLIDSEQPRERIRADGVNLFVSVEEFLSQLITYNVWILASDHFLETKHDFDMLQAREAVPRVLGSELQSGVGKVHWSVEGENSLGVLLRYLSKSEKWMKGLLGAEREALVRPETDMPHFALDIHKPFPFVHRALWADCDQDELRKYVERYGSIVSLLEQSNLAVVRNGLDHYREESRFPGSDTMLACVARLREAFALVNVNRYIPKVFWLRSRTSDRFGAIRYELEDAERKVLVLYGPALVWALQEISYGMPILIAPRNLLGLPNADLVFRLVQANEYNKYWAGYPRRREIGPRRSDAGDQLDEVDTHDNGASRPEAR